MKRVNAQPTPLGFRDDGTPFWVYFGGSEGSSELAGGGGSDAGDDEGDEDDDEGSDDVSRLSRALESERVRSDQARRSLRPWLSLARELGVKSPEDIRAKLTATSGKEQETQEAVRAAEQKVLKRANDRILRSEIKAIAALEPKGRSAFADPSDAMHYLNLDDYEVDETGDVPVAQIEADLKALLVRKPHLAKVSKRVDYEGGARGGAGRGGTDMNDLIRRTARRG